MYELGCLFAHLCTRKGKYPQRYFLEMMNEDMRPEGMVCFFQCIKALKFRGFPSTGGAAAVMFQLSSKHCLGIYWGRAGGGVGVGRALLQ